MNVRDYDVVLIGGSIYAGKMQRTVVSFCERNRAALLQRSVGIFLCCLYQGEDALMQLQSAFPDWLLAHAFARVLPGRRDPLRPAHVPGPPARPRPAAPAGRPVADERSAALDELAAADPRARTLHRRRPVRVHATLLHQGVGDELREELHLHPQTVVLVEVSELRVAVLAGGA